MPAEQICPVCDTEYPSHVMFCLQDGTALVDLNNFKEAVLSQAPDPFRPSSIKPENKRRYASWMPLVLIAFLMVLVAFVAWGSVATIFFSGNPEAPQ